MSTRNPDPLAVIVAEALHQRYRQLATILFGSRARETTVRTAPTWTSSWLPRKRWISRSKERFRGTR